MAYTHLYLVLFFPNFLFEVLRKCSTREVGSYPGGAHIKLFVLGTCRVYKQWAYKLEGL